MAKRKTTKAQTASALDTESTDLTTADPGDRAVAPESQQRTTEAREIEPLARELSLAYKRAVDYYREKRGMSFKKADKEARRALRSLTLYNFDVEVISWLDLSREVPKDKAGAYEFWRYLKRFATDEFESGHRAASSMSYNDTPFERAQFLAIRDALIAEWKPRGASELMLIDSMVQAYCAQLFWMEELHRRSVFEFKEDRETKWLTPRVTTAEATEQAAAMLDRFHKIYVRALRNLRDLRRYAPNLVIQGAGQVNIGQQQIIRQDGANGESSMAQADRPSANSEGRTDAVDYLGPEQDESQVLNATRHF